MTSKLQNSNHITNTCDTVWLMSWLHLYQLLACRNVRLLGRIRLCKKSDYSTSPYCGWPHLTIIQISENFTFRGAIWIVWIQSCHSRFQKFTKCIAISVCWLFHSLYITKTCWPLAATILFSQIMWIFCKSHGAKNLEQN